MIASRWSTPDLMLPFKRHFAEKALYSIRLSPAYSSGILQSTIGIIVTCAENGKISKELTSIQAFRFCHNNISSIQISYMVDLFHLLVTSILTLPHDRNLLFLVLEKRILDWKIQSLLLETQRNFKPKEANVWIMLVRCNMHTGVYTFIFLLDLQYSIFHL